MMGMIMNGKRVRLGITMNMINSFFLIFTVYSLLYLLRGLQDVKHNIVVQMDASAK